MAGEEGQGAGSGDAGEGAGEATVVEEHDVRDAISDSITEARERLHEGGSLVPDEDAPGGEAEELEDVPAEGEPEEVAAAGEGEEAPAADVEDEDAEPGDVEGEPEDAEEELEEEGDDGEGEEAEPEVVALPGRRPDDEEVEIEVDDPEVAERIRQLRNMGLRGHQFRERITAVEEREAEQDFIDTELEADPAGFLLERTAKEHRKEVLYALLANDELYEDDEVQDHLRDWEVDPESRKDFRTKHKDERERAAEKRKRQARATRAARSAVRDIAQDVLSLIPDGMEEDKQGRFYRAAMRAAETEVMSSGKLEISRNQLIHVLDHEGLLQAYSIDPEGAASNSGVAAGNGSRPSRPKARPRKGGSAKEGSEDVEEARSTGQRLKERSKKRREAAAAAPAGAGAPAASTELPEGQSVKERIAYVRKKNLVPKTG